MANKDSAYFRQQAHSEFDTDEVGQRSIGRSGAPDILRANTSRVNSGTYRVIEAQEGTGRSASTTPRQSRPLSDSRLLASPFLSIEERRTLADAMSAPKKVAAHTHLAREGERTDTLFILTDGWACRYETTREGGRQLSALLVPGDVINLDALMFESLNYGAQALTAATVVTLPREHAKALVTQHAGVAAAFTWLAMVENTTLSKWTLSLGRRSARERLAHLLCELSVRLNAESDGQSSFSFPLTQQHLADALGLTPVHISRTMGQLRDEGLIEIENRVMNLPNVAQLRHVGGFDQRYLHA